MEEDEVLRVLCPACELWYDADGASGIVPHVLEYHPFSTVAQVVDDVLLEGILAGRLGG